MKKKNEPRSNKKIFVMAGTSVVVIAAICGGIYLYGNNQINSALKAINTDELSRTEYMVSEFETVNQISSNTKQIKFDGDFNYDKNYNLASENSRLANQVRDRLTEDCKKNESRYKYSLNFVAKLANSKKYSELKELQTVIPERLGEDCNDIDGIIGNIQFNSDYIKANSDITRVSISEYKDTAPIDNLAKFSDGTYKVKDISSIKASYGDATELAINETIKSIGLFYESFVASRDGNQALSDQKWQEFQSLNVKKEATYKSAESEYFELAKERNSKILKAEIRFHNILSSLNNEPEKTQYSNGIIEANLLASALSSYSSDNNEKVPVTADVKELVSILKEKRYLDNVNLSLSNVTYSSAEEKTYTLTFKNELTDKKYSITVQL